MGKLTRKRDIKTILTYVDFDLETLDNVISWCNDQVKKYGDGLRLNVERDWDGEYGLELQQVICESDEELSIRQKKHDASLVKRRKTLHKIKLKKEAKREELELEELKRLTKKYGEYSG